MALVELDDDLVGALNQVLEDSNRHAVLAGFEAWTLGQLIREMIWDEMKKWQRNQTVARLRDRSGANRPPHRE